MIFLYSKAKKDYENESEPLIVLFVYQVDAFCHPKKSLLKRRLLSMKRSRDVGPGLYRQIPRTVETNGRDEFHHVISRQIWRCLKKDPRFFRGF